MADVCIMYFHDISYYFRLPILYLLRLTPCITCSNRIFTYSVCILKFVYLAPQFMCTRRHPKARLNGVGRAILHKLISAGSGKPKASLFNFCLHRCAWALSYLDLIGQLFLSISLELIYRQHYLFPLVFIIFN